MLNTSFAYLSTSFAYSDWLLTKKANLQSTSWQSPKCGPCCIFCEYSERASREPQNSSFLWLSLKFLAAGGAFGLNLDKHALYVLCGKCAATVVCLVHTKTIHRYNYYPQYVTIKMAAVPIVLHDGIKETGFFLLTSWNGQTRFTNCMIVLQ